LADRDVRGPVQRRGQFPLRRVEDDGKGTESVQQWIISPDLQALINGDGLHNIGYDLATWLASERSPAGECDYCCEDVDARGTPGLGNC